MRSPTLLTGVTGAVAVLVFVYVGLTEMGLQPRITFGEPNVRVATTDKAPANPGPAPAAGSPVISTAPSTAVAAQAPVAVVSPVPPPTATQETPPTAVSPVPAPAMPAVVPQMPPSPAATALPAAAVPSPSASAVASPAWLPSVPEGAALSGTAAAQTPPASVEPSPVPPSVVSAEPVPPPASDASISERMAPPPPSTVATPPTPPAPRVASVPTPLARPRPTAAEEAETPPVVAATKPPVGTEEIQKPAVAETLPSDDKRGQVDRAAPPPLDNKAPPSESAALAQQPEKLPQDATSIEQPNGALKPVDLARPFAERAGILTIGGRSVQLAGIVPTDPERSCTGPNGKDWPCGTLARTALRSFLLGRTITCDVPDPAWKGMVTAECRFAKLSIGDWLARNGWAEVASGSPFAVAADEARKAGRGVYGNDPRKKHQSTLAPEPPKEDPLNPI